MRLAKSIWETPWFAFNPCAEVPEEVGLARRAGSKSIYRKPK